MTDINNHLREINSIPRIGRERRVSRSFEAAVEICTPPNTDYHPFAKPKHRAEMNQDGPSRARPFWRYTAGLHKGVAL